MPTHHAARGRQRARPSRPARIATTVATGASILAGGLAVGCKLGQPAAADRPRAGLGGDLVDVREVTTLSLPPSPVYALELAAEQPQACLVGALGVVAASAQHARAPRSGAVAPPPAQ